MKKGTAVGAVIIIALLASATSLLTGCSVSGQGKGQGQPPPAPVTVSEVKPQDVAIFSDFSAQTYARNTVDVRGRVEADAQDGRR